MNKISARQVYFFLACVAPVGKLVLLPAKLAEYAGGDLWIPALLHFVLQAAAVFCVLLFCREQKSLSALLEERLGKVGAKILLTLFALFFVFAGILPVFEQKLFVQGVFYDTLPSLIAFGPFFLFAAYLCSKPLSSMGRVFDIIAPLSIAAFFGILLFSAGSSDLGAVLPVGASGGSGLMQGIGYSFSWFFDAALLAMMAGKIEYRKGMAWKGALCYLAGGIAVVFFLMIFYGIFEGTAINQLFAFSKTSKYFSGITVLGRVDYLFIFTLSLVAAFYTAMPITCAIECAVQAFGHRRRLSIPLSLLICVLYLVLIRLFDYRFGEIMQAISQQAFWVFPLFGLLLPALCLLLRRKKHESA